MAQFKKLSAPVGDPNAKRPAGAKPVKNDPKDLEEVRKMLIGAGVLSESVRSATYKALKTGIKQATIHYGGGKTGGVIDPESRTVKGLLTECVRRQREKQKAGKIYKITLKGKTAYLSESQYNKARDKLVANMSRLATALRREYQGNYATWQQYNRIAAAKEGILKSAIFNTSSLLGGAGSINLSLIKEQGAKITSLEAALAKKDLAKVHKTLPPAAKATDTAYKEVQRFLKAFGKGTSRGEIAATVTSSAGFIAVGAMAAPMLVTSGMSTAMAAVTAETGVAMINTAATQFGKHSAGDKVTASSAVKAILENGLISALSAGAASRLPTKFVDDFAKAAVSRVTAKVPGLSPKIAKKILQDYLGGGTSAAAKEAAGQIPKIVAGWVKKGDKFGAADIEAALQDIIFAGLSAGPLGELSKSQAKVSMKSRDVLNQEMIPSALQK